LDFIAVEYLADIGRGVSNVWLHSLVVKTDNQKTAVSIAESQRGSRYFGDPLGLVRANPALDFNVEALGWSRDQVVDPFLIDHVGHENVSRADRAAPIVSSTCNGTNKEHRGEVSSREVPH